MRLYEIEIKEQDFTDIKNIIPTIKTQCSEFLSIAQTVPGVKKTGRDIVNNNFLYRGFKRRTEDVLTGSSRDERKSRDTLPQDYLWINEWLSNNGFPVRRDNCTFAVADKSIAGRYGDVFMLFPVNGFQYVWFGNAIDLWITSRQYKREQLKVMWHEQPFRTREEVDTFMRWAIPQKTNLQQAMEWEHEIMIRGQYIAIRLYENNEFYQIIEELFR